MDPYNRDGRYGNRQPQGTGFGGRLLIALAIALVGLFMYWNQVQVNPVTGEKQHVAISPEQEIRLGLESAPQMAHEMGGEVPASDPRAKEVLAMGEYLVSHTAAAKSPWKFNFHLLADDQTVNAFALPGGQIFITLGLYKRLQNEAQLAGVLSHEMGHVIERHSAQQMAKNQLGQLMVVAVGTAASDYSQNQSNPAMIAALVNQMIQLRYSRGDETEADKWGLMLMTQAGYNPQAMVDVMEILKKAGGGGRGPAMFATHPDPDLRIEQINAYLKTHPPGKDLKEGEALPQGGLSNQEDPFRGLFWRFP